MRVWLLFLLSLGGLVGCGDGESPTGNSPTTTTPPAASADNEFQWTGQIAEGEQIEIKGVNGGVRAMAAAGSLVEVSATKRGERNDPSRVIVEVVEHGDGVTICAVYPAPPGEPENECLPGDAGRANVGDNDVIVEFLVMLPANVDFVGRTVNGRVEATDVESDVSARTINGEVVISTSRHADASTVNGRVSVSLGLPNWERDLEHSAVNGTVTIELPSDTNARVRASTVNGSVRSDFPLASTSPRSAQGTIGNGGPLLTMSTVNGDINLNRGPASGR